MHRDAYRQQRLPARETLRLSACFLLITCKLSVNFQLSEYICPLLAICRQWHWLATVNTDKTKSCAIAKMTAWWALYKWIEWAVAEIWPFEIIQDGGLPPTCIWCNRKWRQSTRRPSKPYTRTKHEVYRITRCGDMTIRVSWGIWNPTLGRGGRRGSAMAPFERAMVVSYRLSIVTVVLSVTIRPQFPIECLMSPTLKSTGVGHFGPRFPGVPLG